MWCSSLSSRSRNRSGSDLVDRLVRDCPLASTHADTDQTAQGSITTAPQQLSRQFALTHRGGFLLLLTGGAGQPICGQADFPSKGPGKGASTGGTEATAQVSRCIYAHLAATVRKNDGLACEVHLALGNPFQAIGDAAQTFDADLASEERIGGNSASS